MNAQDPSALEHGQAFLSVAVDILYISSPSHLIDEESHNLVNANDSLRCIYNSVRAAKKHAYKTLNRGFFHVETVCSFQWMFLDVYSKRCKDDI